ATHADPAKQPLLEELQMRYPLRPDSPHASFRVMQSREPLLMHEVSDAVLRAHCVDDGHARLIREIGVRSVIVVPLITRGEVIGPIPMGAKLGRYEPADLDLAEELAHRAAMAIDNARLYREVQHAVSLRDEFLAIASHELRGPVTALGLALEALFRADPSR